MTYHYRLSPDASNEPTLWRYDGLDDPTPLALAHQWQNRDVWPVIVLGAMALDADVLEEVP